MTEYLGNFDELSTGLARFYPKKTFLLLNYGFGSTNILSVQDRLEKPSTHSGRIFQPVNDIPFDYIFIESFGNNPLSQFPLDEGLQKQTQALDQIIETITLKHPKSSIIFIATVAPIRKRYGEGVVNLLPEQRQAWADERIAYIKNHLQYAASHHIPVVNIFEASLTSDGSGNIDYINTNDFIHPSPTGIRYINEEIARFVAERKLVKD